MFSISGVRLKVFFSSSSSPVPIFRSSFLIMKIFSGLVLGQDNMPFLSVQQSAVREPRVCTMFSVLELRIKINKG